MGLLEDGGPRVLPGKWRGSAGGCTARDPSQAAPSRGGSCMSPSPEEPGSGWRVTWGGWAAELPTLSPLLCPCCHLSAAAKNRESQLLPWHTAAIASPIWCRAMGTDGILPSACNPALSPRRRDKPAALPTRWLQSRSSLHPPRAPPARTRLSQLGNQSPHARDHPYPSLTALHGWLPSTLESPSGTSSLRGATSLGGKAASLPAPGPPSLPPHGEGR